MKIFLQFFYLGENSYVIFLKTYDFVIDYHEYHHQFSIMYSYILYMKMNG